MTNPVWVNSTEMKNTKLSQMTAIKRKGFITEEKLNSFMYEIYSNTFSKEVFSEGTLRLRIDEADLWLGEKEVESLVEVFTKYLKDRKASLKMAETIIAARGEDKDE